MNEVFNRIDSITIKSEDGIYKKIQNPCLTCNGVGLVWESPTYEHPEGGPDELCETCNGSGETIDPAGLERAAELLYYQSCTRNPVKKFEDPGEDFRKYWRAKAEEIIRAYYEIEPNILIPAYHHYPYDNRKEYVHFLKRKQHGYIGKPLKTLCGGIELTPLENFVFVNPNDIHPGGRRFHDGSFMDMRWKEVAFCQRCYDGWKKNHKALITSETWEAELKEAKDEWDRMEARR